MRQAPRCLGDATNAPCVSTAVLVQVSTDGGVPPSGQALEVDYEYDAEGNLTKVTDANGAATSTSYDSLSRGRQTTQPVPAAAQASPVIATAYDLRDQVSSVTDPRGLVTSYTTDGLGNTSQQSSPDTGTTTSSFYDNGLLHTRQDARGRVATYTYDALDRIAAISYDAGVDTSFAYDQGAFALGKLSSFTDESGNTSYTYDSLGHIASKVQVVTAQSAMKTFNVGYDWHGTGSATGKLQRISYPSGAQVVYGFDATGRLGSISVVGVDGRSSTILAGLAYTGTGMPESWVWGDGTSYQRAYDGYGRLVSYTLGNPAGTGASAGVTRTIAYDAAGRIVGYSHVGNAPAPAANDEVFSYDGLDRLVSAQVTGSQFGYTYDPTGNRTGETINGTAYALTVSPTSNQYTLVQGAAGTSAQGFDAAGHLQADGSGSYTYSSRGRMQSATRASGAYGYLYNAFEQRVAKVGSSAFIPTGAAYFVYDEAGHLLGEYDATGKALYETVYFGDTPVASLTQPAIGQTNVAFAYADHLNTARVIARASDHAIVWQWGSNEPFGQTQANANPNGLGNYVYDPRFPGQVADAESGWFYNWNRDYSPAQGRYVQSDPIGLSGGINTYSYAEDAPTTYVDPDGESVFKIISLCAKGYRVIKEVGFAEAVKAVKQGENVLGPSHGLSRKVAKAASKKSGKATRDNIHPDPVTGETEGRMPHYHPNPRTGSHVFYSIASALTVSNYVDCDDCVAGELAAVADFFNPLSAPKDIMDTVDDLSQ